MSCFSFSNQSSRTHICRVRRFELVAASPSAVAGANNRRLTGRTASLGSNNAGHASKIRPRMHEYSRHSGLAGSRTPCDAGINGGNAFGHTPIARCTRSPPSWRAACHAHARAITREPTLVHALVLLVAIAEPLQSQCTAKSHANPTASAVGVRDRALRQRAARVVEAEVRRATRAVDARPGRNGRAVA